MDNRRLQVSARHHLWAVVGVAARVAWPTLVYTALAILFTWPLAAGLGNHLTELGDPLDQVWRLNWGQQQLLHDPRHLFDAPVFYPYPRSYLFDELLLGAAILTLPLRLVTANP